MDDNICVEFEESACYYQYTVIFIDEVDMSDAPYRKVIGVTRAESLTKAVNKITDYYGEDNIDKLTITSAGNTGASDLYEISDIGVKYDWKTGKYVEMT